MKKTKKLIGAVGALAMSVALAAGSTFAWFSTNQKVSVQAFETTVTTGSTDLKVAVSKHESTYKTPDASKFKATLTTADIVGTKNETSGKYENGAIDLNTLKLDALTTSDNGLTLKGLKKEGETLDPVATNTQYAEFDLTFRSNTKNVKVALGTASAVTPGTAATAATPVYAWKDITASDYGINKEGNAEKIAMGSTITARAAYAARVAFIVGGASKVWSPNEANANGGEASSNVTGKGIGFWKGNLADDYNLQFVTGYKTCDQIAYADGNVITSTGDNDGFIGTTASSATQIPVEGGSPKELAGCYDLVVTVRIWLEGTDGDCFNAILGDGVNTALSFVALTETA